MTLFLFPRHCNGKLLPAVAGFQILFDPNIPLPTSQGGQAAASVKFYSFLCNKMYYFVLNFNYTELQFHISVY